MLTSGSFDDHFLFVVPFKRVGRLLAKKNVFEIIVVLALVSGIKVVFNKIVYYIFESY